MMPLSCYIHIPFCAKICTYCDFYRLVHDKRWENSYSDAICSEIDLRCRQWQVNGVLTSYTSTTGGKPVLSTLYFGGGTPSVISGESWRTIVAQLREHFAFSDSIEFTSEANPESASVDKLQILKDVGVNRLSFGAQSFVWQNLYRLGRLHSADQVGVALNSAREVGFGNISMDLMYGLPDETDETFEFDLTRAVELGPEHISFYSLMLEGDVPLRYQVLRREVKLPDEDSVVERYRGAVDLLSALGFDHYEISNFAQDGFKCRHNLAYWEGNDYVAFGPAAVGTIGNVRYKNEPDIYRYVKALAENRLPPADVESLNPGKQLIETIMLSLRLKRGLDYRSLFTKYDYDILRVRRDLIAALESDGDVIIENGHLRLTPRGMLRSDLIMSMLLPDFV